MKTFEKPEIAVLKLSTESILDVEIGVESNAAGYVEIPGVELP